MDVKPKIVFKLQLPVVVDRSGSTKAERRQFEHARQNMFLFTGAVHRTNEATYVRIIRPLKYDFRFVISLAPSSAALCTIDDTCVRLSSQKSADTTGRCGAVPDRCPNRIGF